MKPIHFLRSSCMSNVKPQRIPICRQGSFSLPRRLFLLSAARLASPVQSTQPQTAKTNLQPTTAINAQSAAISHSSCRLCPGCLSELMLMLDTHIIMMPPTQSASANKSCRTFRDVTNLGTVNEVSVTARISQLSLSIAIAHPTAPAIMTWLLDDHSLQTYASSRIAARLVIQASNLTPACASA